VSLPKSDALPNPADASTSTGAARPPVIVIGMHRSGTSLVARILSELGVHIGAELDRHNEAICFKQVNRDLLESHGAHWARPEPFVSHLLESASLEADVRLARASLERWAPSYGEIQDDQAWGWKDPRNTLTLPVWLEIFPQASIIHVVRNGLDVALSLGRREPRRLLRFLQGRPMRDQVMLPPTIARGYDLWASYVQRGLDLEICGAPWLTLRYEELVSDPAAAIMCLTQFLRIEVDDGVLQDLGERIIREPAQQSRFEGWRLRFLFGSGMLDPQPLRSLGYEPEMRVQRGDTATR
jgi:hypothetical protein